MPVDGLHAPQYIVNPINKGIVVFIHGFLGSPCQFDSLAQTAYGQGYSIAKLLLPGHGGSAKDFASGTYHGWQTHVDAEVGRFSRDNERIWLAGHSMGGLLAVNAAVRYSEYVRGLFTIACPFRIMILNAHSIKIRIKQVSGGKNDPIKISYLSNCSVDPSPSLAWRGLKPAFELKKLMAAARENLPLVRVPVTAVFSTGDELTSFASLDIMKDGLTGAVFEPVVLADSLHAFYPGHEQLMIERALLDILESADRR